jgi:ribonuclease-3
VVASQTASSARRAPAPFHRGCFRFTPRHGATVDVDVAALQKRLGIKFKRPELLAQAMIHRSYLNEAAGAGVESNERLEFLGDAVLGCVIARRLFERYPAVHEGRLTELRAHLVKGEALAVVAERLQLGSFLFLGRGEDATGGRRRPLNLARAFEAVLGAVYLDCGFARTERFILRTLGPELAELGGGDLPTDAKSRLQHLAQTVFGAPPRYRTVSADGPDHAKIFTIEVVLGDRSLGSGRGRSKRHAEKLAAEEALKTIDRELHTDGPPMRDGRAAD